METLETRLDEVARIAVRLEQETGCPAQLLIAQWAIESKWGEKPVGHANYFGIESLEFADYASLEDFCRDYVWLITNGAPYHEAWVQYQQHRNLPALIAAVARVYATDPGYCRLAESIASQSNVQVAVAEANVAAVTAGLPV